MIIKIIFLTIFLFFIAFLLFTMIRLISWDIEKENDLHTKLIRWIFKIKKNK